MKVVVNSGRMVHVVDKQAAKQADGSFSRPTVKAHGPTRRLELPEDEAKRLIAIGAVREDKPIEEDEQPKDPPKDPKGK